MPTADSPTTDCSIQRTLDLIGDRWTLLILRDIFRGVRRFSQIQNDLGIAKNLLAYRLNSLVDAEIVTKIPYQDRPVRHEYILTDKGRALSPALVALMRWGDDWCLPGEAPTELYHEACATRVELQPWCTCCNEAVPPSSIRSRPGPGLTSSINTISVGVSP
ncbi:MAG: helix-turn-helix transcriptional regulator [Acidimicrobiaceae bacterium]|nr:helix-turn-helix transcriptional regulator [Acidimicrobiaceae bacterium]MBT5580189.1 helix-turn-helix transcriptional regulator [Acidimicrobiaceae bacterium]MBT5850780.1 helix-turn-helix transcriptional regulator [Acidimicrobiaceae bacterium]